MAYFYVKSGGTATGDNGRYASQQTGTFATLGASGYYPSIYSAINTPTTAPTSGDYILCSDLHSLTADVGAAVVIPSGVSIISVDDTNVDQYKPGATENLSDTSDDYTFNKNNLICGMDLETGDNVLEAQTAESYIRVQDTILRPDASGDAAIYVQDDGVYVKLINVDVIGNSVLADYASLKNGSRLEHYGGSIQNCEDLFIFGTDFGGNGGASAHLVGVNMSGPTRLLGSIPAGSDNVYLRLDHCQLNPGVTMPSSFGKQFQRFEMFNCDDSTGDALYRFYIADYAGTASNNDTTYVTATESWYEGSDKSSIEVTTTANCSHSVPFTFELPAQYVDLSSTGTVTLDIVYDSAAFSLTDTEIAAFLVYPDATVAVDAKVVTSGKTVGAGNYGIDPLAPGTTLPAGTLTTGDWSGLSGMTTPATGSLVLATTTPQATAITVTIGVYRAGILSGQLYIHPIVSLS